MREQTHVRRRVSAAACEIAGRNGGRVPIAPEQLEHLRARLDGAVLLPGDAGWDDAILLWNGMAARTPSMVVQPVSARDVATAVLFARENDLLISVKGGGHNIAGTAIGEQGLTLDMSRMRGVRVDPGARLAHVEPGCRLKEIDRATQQHGLATVLGFISEVGAAGLTLGGGLGYLTRRFGWTADNLEEVEIVTASGDVCTASRHARSDLFWALRGGGGNFGVVTRLTYRLHRVGPSVYGGLIAWPFQRAGDVLEAYKSLTANAPRELSVWMIFLCAPSAPFVPAAWHGKRVCAMVICYSGDVADAPGAIAPIRAIGNPILDLLREQPYTQLQSFLDETEPKGHHYYWKTEFVAALPGSLLETLRELFEDCPIPEAQIGLLHLGGALNEREPDDGAVGNRDVRYAVGVNGMWEPGEPAAEGFRRWIRGAWERVRPFSTGGNYINFQTADEGDERVRATYGENYPRLARIKEKYDPDNLFRVNRNIRV